MNGTEIRKGNRGRGERLWSWLFLLPTILFLGFTALLPLLYSLYLSLFQYKINLPNAVPKFIGIGNYLRMLQDKNLGVSVGNTVLFAVVSVSLELVLGLLAAMMLCGTKRIYRIFTSLLLIPMIMAPVAIGTLFRMMLDGSTGIINYLLHFVGVPQMNWLSNPKTAMPAVIFVNVWQLIPWVCIITMAGLKSLPQDALEAARVDGAKNRHIFFQIVLPMISPLLIIVLMLRFVDAFKVFDTIYTMTNGGPGNATEMLPNYIYKQGLKFFDAGYTAALAMAFVFSMTIVSFLFLRWRRHVEEKVL